MKKSIVKSICVMLLFCTALNVQARTNEKYIGVDIKGGTSIVGMYENIPTFGTTFCDVNYFNIGLYYEHQFAKYFRYNFGVNYLLKQEATSFQTSLGYISIPANIEFTSNIMNFGVGFRYDALLGVKSVQGIGYKPLRGFDIAAQAHLSKDIKLTKSFIIEPTLSFLYYILTPEMAVHAGVKVKYRIPEKLYISHD